MANLVTIKRVSANVLTINGTAISASGTQVDLEDTATRADLLKYVGYYDVVSQPGGSIAGTISNADIASGAAIAYSKLNLTGSIVNADVNASAAIAKTKLAPLNIGDSDITGTGLTNAALSSSAGIAYSKLVLGGSVVNSDIATSAAIAKSKLAALNIGDSDVAAGGLTNSSISASAAITPGKLAPGTANTVLTTSGSTNSWTTLTNANIDAAAAIAYSKLALTGNIVRADMATSSIGAYCLAYSTVQHAFTTSVASFTFNNAYANSTGAGSSSAAGDIITWASGASSRVVCGRAGLVRYSFMTQVNTLTGAGAGTTIFVRLNGTTTMSWAANITLGGGWGSYSRGAENSGAVGSPGPGLVRVSANDYFEIVWQPGTATVFNDTPTPLGGGYPGSGSAYAWLLVEYVA
jgi:hypothetical protein